MRADRNKFRFRVGLVLIGASYPLWAGAILFGALQLRGSVFPWWRAAAAALVLNWLCFVAGILIAGREAARYFHKRVIHFIKQACAKGKTKE